MKATPPPSLSDLRVVSVVGSDGGMAGRRRWGGGDARVGVPPPPESPERDTGERNKSHELQA
jgi:hypothetical protein